MRFGIWMEVGILEKSRRLRIARISLGMLSPENLPSRPPEWYCQHRTSDCTREGRALARPPGFGSDAQLQRSSEPAALDCRGPVRRMSYRVLCPGTDKS